MRRPFRHKPERGQVLMIAAVLLPVLLGMTGVAIDVGTYASDRRALQNAADGMALAAGEELPDNSAATAAALALADDHGVNPAHVSVAFTGGANAPAVHVRIARSHDFIFMGILGIFDREVEATAAAELVSPAGGEGIVPWSITQETVDAAASGEVVTIKYDSNGDYGQGNFGAVRIDGNGSSVYEDAIKYGADSMICSTATPNCAPGNCPGTFPTTCAENAPECDGYECLPKTGNMTGATRVATDFRMDNTSDECDTFEEAFTPPSAGGKYEINPNCNPWSGGRCSSNADTSCSRRVFLIPIVDDFGNGSSDPLTTVGFVLVYLEGYEGSCTGSSCDIRARFVDAQVTIDGYAGAYDPDAGVHFVRLTE